MSRREVIHKRVRWSGGVILALFAVLLGRAVELQLAKGVVLRSLADSQHSRTQTIVPPRGEILDRNGEELAVSISMDSIYADPQGVEEPHAAARLLSPLLHRPVDELASMLSRSNRFVWLERQLEPAVAAAVRELEIPGIHFTKEPKRFYPNGPLMGQLLGFVGIDGEGLEGLERRYEQYLRGQSEVVELQRDARGRGIATAGLAGRLSASSYRLQLTIDKAIAYEAQKALDAAVAEYEALNGVAVVQDVETGAILASVVSPSFDPNAFSSYPVGYGRNRVVGDVYEPGSTLKAVLLAAALEEGAVEPNTLFFAENGQYNVRNRTIRDTKKHGWLSAAQVVKVSSNIGALKIAAEVGREPWFDYLRAFGFGAHTGIDVPGESRGLMRPLREWNEVLVATSSFGQGIGATPIQVVNAMSAIANGGRLMKPYLVSRILDDQGNTVHETKPEMLGRPIGPEAAQAMWPILRSVVHDGGTGTQAAVPGYEVAGKTGTAQKVDPEAGGYSRDKFIASFLGFIPARDPRVAIYVSVNEPKGSVYGGTVAAPVFAAIAAKAMQQLRIPAEHVVMPESLEGDGGRFSRKFVNAGAGSEADEYAGLTIREALRLASQRDEELVPRGSGLARESRCVEQVCEVLFKPL